MALTREEVREIGQLLEECVRGNAEQSALRKIARDPIKRRKQFKIVPGAALSSEAARLAQFYQQAPREQRAAFDALMSVFAKAEEV